MEALYAFFARLLGPLDRQTNPILVKEIRQALRGRYFPISFIVMVTVATLIACVILVMTGIDHSDDAGVFFFIAMYGCLSLAVHVFVPFSAFLSVGAEWEENTFDLLVLSNLRPRQIVGGKLLSAVLQVLLFYTTFGPFLVFAFLLRGLDLVAAFWVLGLTLVSSTTLACVALFLSSLVRQRFARVFLMAVLAVLLVWVGVGAIPFSYMVFEERFVHTPEFRQAAGAMSTAGLTVAAFAFAFACTRFAHPEENRSSALRVLTTLTLLFAIGWMAYLYGVLRQPGVIVVLTVLLLFGSFATSVFFCTEEERLGRRVRLQVPRARLTALLVAPFLPGGGRGVLFFLVNSALIGAALLVHLEWARPIPTPGEEFFLLPLGLYLYSVLYLLGVSFLFHRRTDAIKHRIAARGMIPMAALLAFMVPTLAGFLLQQDGVRGAEHVGNPVWVLERAIEENEYGELWLVALGAGAALALNVPRVLAGLREVLACSARRRAWATPTTSSTPGSSPEGSRGESDAVSAS